MKKNTLWGEISAELLGTMILILFGTGVVAQVVTGDGAAGDHDSIAWAWGIGVTLGVYVAARISGAHLNPAVTIALAAFKGFEWRKVAPYIAAQVVGAFIAALIIRATYADLIDKIDPHHTYASQGIFSTSPTAGVSIPSAGCWSRSSGRRSRTRGSRCPRPGRGTPTGSTPRRSARSRRCPGWRTCGEDRSCRSGRRTSPG